MEPPPWDRETSMEKAEKSAPPDLRGASLGAVATLALQLSDDSAIIGTYGQAINRSFVPLHIERCHPYFSPQFLSALRVVLSLCRASIILVQYRQDFLAVLRGFNIFEHPHDFPVRAD